MSNGMVGRFHRKQKAASRASFETRCPAEYLPIVSFDIRALLKEHVGLPLTELLYFPSLSLSLAPTDLATHDPAFYVNYLGANFQDLPP